MVGFKKQNKTKTVTYAVILPKMMNTWAGNTEEEEDLIQWCVEICGQSVYVIAEAVCIVRPAFWDANQVFA